MQKSDLSHEYFKYVSGISTLNIRHILIRSPAYLKHISSISQVYNKYISGIYRHFSRIHIAQGSGISYQAPQMHISEIFQASIEIITGIFPDVSLPSEISH